MSIFSWAVDTAKGRSYAADLDEAMHVARSRSLGTPPDQPGGEASVVNTKTGKVRAVFMDGAEAQQ